MLGQPRIVIVTRKTPLELLIERHGTIEQTAFYLRARGEDTAFYRNTHTRFEAGLAQVVAALPPDRRRTRVDRDALDRFLFAPDDIVFVVGQDGLVANVAKYLQGQTVVGINPDPEHYDGVLCPHPPDAAALLLGWLEKRDTADLRLQRRVMALAEREDGQRLRALNEVFVGHRTHQSARYRIRAEDREERQSSSGVICATGTGSTGWARSIAEQRRIQELPRPEQQRLVWFVREPFPSISTRTSLDFGQLESDMALELHSEMSEGGVIFADGIEADRVDFLSGQTVRLRVDEQALCLLVPGHTHEPSRTEDAQRAAGRLGAGRALRNRPGSLHGRGGS